MSVRFPFPGRALAMRRSTALRAFARWQRLSSGSVHSMWKTSCTRTPAIGNLPSKRKTMKSAHLGIPVRSSVEPHIESPGANSQSGHEMVKVTDSA